jgi:hypothetical protein
MRVLGATVKGAAKPVMRAVVKVIRGVVDARDVRKRIVVKSCVFVGVVRSSWICLGWSWTLFDGYSCSEYI